MGHVLMENRSGLAIDARLTQATGTAERKAALELVDDVPGSHRIALSADKVTVTTSSSTRSVSAFT